MRINEGYAIIASVPLNEREEIVIGRNYNDMYVVWTCRDGDNYFWGHYVMTYKQALKELIRKLKLANAG